MSCDVDFGGTVVVPWHDVVVAEETDSLEAVFVTHDGVSRTEEMALHHHTVELLDDRMKDLAEAEVGEESCNFLQTHSENSLLVLHTLRQRNLGPESQERVAGQENHLDGSDKQILREQCQL